MNQWEQDRVRMCQLGEKRGRTSLDHIGTGLVLPEKMEEVADGKMSGLNEDLI